MRLFAELRAESLPQKPPSSTINNHGSLSNPTPAVRPSPWERVFMVESRCGAVAVGWAYLFAAPHMGVIRSRGFVPSFSPFVSDPKSEPSVIRPVYRCSYQPHIRSPLDGGRTNIALTAGKGSRGGDQSFVRPFKARWVQGQRGGAVVHSDLLGLINPSRLQN